MKREERDVSQHDPVKDHNVMFFFVVVLQFPFDAEDEIDLTLDILGAPLYIPEFLSSDAEDCLTKVIKEWEEKIDEVNTLRDFLLWFSSLAKRWNQILKK